MESSSAFSTRILRRPEVFTQPEITLSPIPAATGTGSPVQRDTVSRTDQQEIAGPCLLCRDYLHFTALYQTDHFWAQVYSIHDLTSAARDCNFLEQLPDTVKEHDADRFLIILYGKCAKRGNAHQKIFVKHMAF